MDERINAEAVDEGQTSIWFKLPEELHRIIVSKLDNRTKRRLRATCLENYAIVNQFQCMDYARPYYCFVYVRTLADDQKSFEVENWVHRGIRHHHTFPTKKAMNEHLQATLNNINTLRELDLVVEGFTEPIQLLKNQRKLKVELLNFRHRCNPGVVNGFINQFEKRNLRTLELYGENYGEQIFGAFELWHLYIHINTFNDAQLLNVNSGSCCIKWPNQLTALGLKNYFKKMLKKSWPSSVECRHLNPELKALLEYGERMQVVVYISPMYSSFSLRLRITKPRPGFMIFNAATIQRDLASQNDPIILNPALDRFVRSIELDL